jgi:hypothetical protein
MKAASVRLGALFLVVAAVLAGSATAEAGWPWAYGYYGGYDWAFQRSALLNNQLPPYYAMFPPVYYRAPIEARTYGTSPFALPPCNCEQAKGPVQPAMIENPYIKEKTEPKSAQKSAEIRRPAPQIVLNPYVTQGPREELAGGAK